MRFKTKTCLTGVRRVLGKDGIHARTGESGTMLYEQCQAADPATPAQTACRYAMSTCAAAWRALTPNQKASWSDAAQRNAAWYGDSQGYLNGYELFMHAALNRVQMGLAAPKKPLSQLRPAPLENAVLQPAGNPRLFAFLVTHRIAAKKCWEYCVRAMLTPPTTGPGRAPDAQNRRLICMDSTDSAQGLVSSGGILVYPPSQIAVPAGSRFGVWLRVVRVDDGLASEDLFLDLMRV